MNTQQYTLDSILDFGKYEGCSIRDIIVIDPVWLLDCLEKDLIVIDDQSHLHLNKRMDKYRELTEMILWYDRDPDLGYDLC